MLFWERNFLIQYYGTFPGWLLHIGPEVFLHSSVGTLLIFQNVASILVVVWNMRGMSSQLNLEKVRRETGGDEPTSDQRSCLLLTTKWLVCRGRGLSWSATYFGWSEKTWLWCCSQPTSTRKWECP
jgi:hypothetical protein